MNSEEKGGGIKRRPPVRQRPIPLTTRTPRRRPGEQHDSPAMGREAPEASAGAAPDPHVAVKKQRHVGNSQVRVHRASDLLRNLDSPNQASTMLRFRWVNDGGAVEVRPVTSEVVVVPVHRFVPDGNHGKVDLRCAGSPCALCMTGNKPEQAGLLLLYWLEDRDFGILQFKITGHPASVAAQLLPLLHREDATEQLIEISRSGNAYRVRRICSLDPEDPNLIGADVGEEALADMLAGGEPTPEDLASLIEKRSNQQLVVLILNATIFLQVIAKQ